MKKKKKKKKKNIVQSENNNKQTNKDSHQKLFGAQLNSDMFFKLVIFELNNLKV